MPNHKATIRFHIYAIKSINQQISIDETLKSTNKFCYFKLHTHNKAPINHPSLS